MLKFIRLFVLLLLCVSEVRSQPAKPKVVPLTTVVRADGTTVRGTITASDRMKITVSPAPAKAGTPPGEAVTIAWTDIKSVSNGLTRSKAQSEWKKKQEFGALCPDCNGDGVRFCPTCHGTGHDPASAVDCPTCHGELLVACKTPGCTDGKIPCPNKCIKAGRFTGKPDADGKRWITVAGPGGGTGKISDGHIGDVYSFAGGQMTIEKCPVCHGTTIVDDPACEASKQPCPTCVTRKDAPPCPDKCDHGKVDCTTCHGTGAKAG